MLWAVLSRHAENIARMTAEDPDEVSPGKRSSRGDSVSVRRRSSQLSAGSGTSISELLETEELALSASRQSLHSLHSLPSPGLDKACALQRLAPIIAHRHLMRSCACRPHPKLHRPRRAAPHS